MNLKNKIPFIIAFYCTGIFCSYAQQLPFYTQNRLNAFLLNPAIAGTKQTIDVRMGHRMQWTGYDGAPSTSDFSVNSRLFKGMLGVGMFGVNDVIGPNKQTHFNLSAAYHLRFPDVELSVGASGYLTQYSLDGTKMTIRDYQDPSINQQISTTTWVKNAGAGIYLYNDRFNIGLSGLCFLQPELKVFREDTSKRGVVKYLTHGNFIFGYNYAFNEKIMTENNFYATYVVGTPIVLDYTFRLHYMKKVFAGASIRLGDALAFHAGYTFAEHFQISYSYDWVISKLSKYNGGSHEIMFVFSHGLKMSKNKFLKQKYSYMF